MRYIYDMTAMNSLISCHHHLPVSIKISGTETMNRISGDIIKLLKGLVLLMFTIY